MTFTAIDFTNRFEPDVRILRRPYSVPFLMAALTMLFAVLFGTTVLRLTAGGWSARSISAVALFCLAVPFGVVTAIHALRERVVVTTTSITHRGLWWTHSVNSTDVQSIDVSRAPKGWVFLCVQSATRTLRLSNQFIDTITKESLIDVVRQAWKIDLAEPPPLRR